MSTNPKPVVNEERIFKVLLGPHVSEKSSIMADKNRQYVFKVTKDATKPQIKRAVEHLFNVNVESLQICNLKGKAKRFKQTPGRRAGRKKAYVKLKEGQDIDFMGKD